MDVTTASSNTDLMGMGGNKRPRGNIENSKVKIALSLYKVQQSIYLLDFQRVEGDSFGFMKLCALIITELKSLSAANKSSSQQLPPPTSPSGGSIAVTYIPPHP